MDGIVDADILTCHPEPHTSPAVQGLEKIMIDGHESNMKRDAHPDFEHTCIAEAHEVLNDLNIATLASDEQRRAALPEEDVNDISDHDDDDGDEEIERCLKHEHVVPTLFLRLCLAYRLARSAPVYKEDGENSNNDNNGDDDDDIVSRQIENTNM